MSVVVRYLPQLSPTLLSVREWSVVGGIALLDLVGVWLITRRLLTTHRIPLGAWSLLATAVVLAAYTTSLRLLWPRTEVGAFAAARSARCASLAAIGMVLVGASLMLPGTHAVAVLGFWAILLTGELLLPRWLAKGRPSVSAPPLPAVRLAAPLAADTREAPQLENADELGELAAADSSVTQRITRRQTEQGTAAVEAWLRADFAAGQRTATLHLAFCPPFAERPEVYAEAVSGPEVTPRVMQVLPTGVRIDVRQPSPSPAPSRVGIQVFAEGRCGEA